MKSRFSTLIAAIALSGALKFTVVVAAQDAYARHRHLQYHHYQLLDLGTLGGANSLITNPITNNISRRGTVLAEAETPTHDPYDPNCFASDCVLVHALQRKAGGETDLGALPGVNNSTPIWINAQGVAAGYSENSIIDPLTGFPETRAVIWEDGQVKDLGTLGGNVSFANSINNRGQVVGVALNTVADSFAGSLLPFSFVFPVATKGHAFLWDEENGMQDLGTITSGSDSMALVVNESGQVTGVSYTSSNPNSNNGPACALNVPTQDPFIWEKGKGMTDLGTLGGDCGWPYALNNRGAVVGDSTPPGDAYTLPFLWTKEAGIQALSTTARGSLGGEAEAINDAGQVVGYGQNSMEAFALLWEKGRTKRLGNLRGANCTIAFSINSHSQVVGFSGNGDSGCSGRAVLWEKDSAPVDLNLLVRPNSPLHMYEAITINDRGEIIGTGSLSNGDIHAFLAIPCDANHPGVEGCDYRWVDAPVAATTGANPAQGGGPAVHRASNQWSAPPFSAFFAERSARHSTGRARVPQARRPHAARLPRPLN